MLQSETKDAMSAVAGEMLALVNINGIPFWRDARTGRTFPQVAGAEDPPGDGNDSDGGDTDEHADDDDSADTDKLRRRIQAQRAGEKRLKDQLKAQSTELETLRARQRERDDAEKTEAERLKGQLAEAEQKRTETERQLQEVQTRRAIERAAAKANAADPDDVYRLLDHSKIERDDGTVTNADKLVEALLKDKPYLLASKGTNGVPPTPRANGTVTQADKVKENEEKLIATHRYTPFG